MFRLDLAETTERLKHAKAGHMKGLKITGLIVVGLIVLAVALVFVAIGVLVIYMVSTGGTWPFVYHHPADPQQ